jgi:outer membrane PBP1 activator LpoA protein
LKIKFTYIGLFLWIIALSGCSHTSAPIHIKHMSSPDRSEAFDLSEQITPQDAVYQMRLTEVEKYLKSGQLSTAENLLANIPISELKSAALQAQHRYLQAQTFKQRHQWRNALTLVMRINLKNLNPNQQAAILQLQAELYSAMNRPIAKVYALTKLSQLENKTELYREIWYTLQPLDAPLLKAAISKSNDTYFKAWLELSYIGKRYADSPTTLKKYVKAWQNKYPNHPHHNALPDDIERTINVRIYNPKKIAVLLPLSGKAAKHGKAVRDGIIANVIQKRRKKIEVQFYNTDNNAEKAYQKAINDGSDFIIGPLLKESIEQLSSNYNKMVPQLVLNHPDYMISDPDRYYFSLSPSAESKQTADYFNQLGLKNPLIIASSHSSNQKIAQGFNEQWLALTGNEAYTKFYNNNKEIKTVVQDALSVIKSKKRIQKVRDTYGSKIKADFRSRKDIDAMYLITFQNEIKLLKPFIDVNTSVFSNPTPLYTNSRSHVISRKGIYPSELNGLMINDMPWLLKTTTEQQLIEAWPHKFKRLYAMGYDSIGLIEKLAQMKASQSYQVNARTGLLSVDHTGVIKRQQNWATFYRGKIRMK